MPGSQRRIATAGLLYGLGKLQTPAARAILREVRDRAGEAEADFIDRLSERTALSLGDSYSSGLLHRWIDDFVLRHRNSPVTPLPITDTTYPPLLKNIPDPPTVLYALGNEDVLSSEYTVAIVGTRMPTNAGMKVANRIAGFFAKAGCLVVSGLAKGIDREAHAATLQANGKTVAVLGTPLDTIYPAENRPLAEQILASGGLLLSELPLGSPSSRAAFVRRDRIQSGLSLAIIPVQSDLSGGTMHTVDFAERQKRLIFCPAPVSWEANAPQYRGIQSLIDTKRGTAFGAADLPRVLSELKGHRTTLLNRPLGNHSQKLVRRRPSDELGLFGPDHGVRD